MMKKSLVLMDHGWMGFSTRLTTVPLIVAMLVAVFYIHNNDPFVKQEIGLLYLLFCLLLVFAGSGEYSADYLIERDYLRDRN